MRIKKLNNMRLIHHLHEPSAPEEGIDIVIVPGVFTPYTLEQRRACSWIKPLAAATTNDTRVFFYEYKLDVERASLWQQLLDHGPLLLEALHSVRQSSGLSQRPIMFICHSLGGVVMKRALVVASQSQSTIEHALCGIIFLGTPSLTAVEDPRWEYWALILKSNRKDVSKQSLGSDDIKRLAAVCRDFRDANVQIPILSIYEGQHSKIRDNLLHSIKSKDKNKVVLVGEDHAEIGAKKEELFKADAAHNELVIVPVEGPLYNRLVKFFKMAVDEGCANVSLTFRQLYLEDVTARTHTSGSSLWYDDVNLPSRRNDQPAHHNQRFDSSDNVENVSAVEFGHQNSITRLPLHLTKAISRNPNFTGQQEILNRMDEILLSETELSNDRSLKSFALCGMGGLGKTEIAIEYILSRRDKFDATFWLSAETTRKLSAGFTEMSRQLQLEDPATGYVDEVATREIVKGWLSKPLKRNHSENSREQFSEAKCLIVFDNADDPDLLFDWWPFTGTGSIIVTSRDPLAKDSPYTLSDGADLQPLSNEEGGKLLQKFSKREKEANGPQLSSKISETLGGLPLALVQMGGIIYRKHYSLKEFLECYQEDAKRLQELRPPGHQMAYRQTVAAVWAVEALPPAASALLKVLSILDADCIQEEMLIKAAKNVSFKDYPSTKSSYVDARYQLIRASLVTRNIDEEELRMHRLVQEVVREKMTPDELQRAFETGVILLAAVWPFTTFKTRSQVWRWQIYDSYLPHIVKWRDLFGEKVRSGDLTASVGAAALFNDAAWYMIERGIPDETAAFLEVAQAILERAKVGNDEEVEKQVSKQLGYNYLYQAIVAQEGMDGELSLKHCKESLEIVVARITKWHDPEDAKDLAEVYNNIALSEVMMNHVDEAIKTWQLAYNAFKNAEDTGKLGPTWPSISLGIVYAQKGEPDKGEEYLAPVLREREKLLGKDDMTSSETGSSWRTMGHIRVAQGRYEEGLEYHRRALVNLRITLGENHSQTADCSYNLAQDLLRIPENEEARELLDRAIAAYGDRPWYKPNAARALWRKGKLLQSIDQKIEAEGYLERAMNIRRNIAPDDHRPEEELTEKDWDDLMFYYSR